MASTRQWMGAALTVAGLSLGVASHAAAPEATAAASAPAPAADKVARGKYLADMGDCAACHTKAGGARFAGGHYMDTPFGALSTPNITPDKATGIGTYTDDEFYRVFHDGIGRVGHLYPAMPYPWFRHVSRDDVLAIKAYLDTLPPVNAPRLPSHIGFPFNIRLGLGIWDAAFLAGNTFQPDPKASAEVNRGNYIVNGLEHCGECHNENKLLGNVTWAKRLQGGVIDGWYAPNITSDKYYGIGRFSDDQIVEFLKTGVSGSMGVVLGPMSQTVHESLSKMSDADLHAIVAYLKSTAPISSYTDAQKTNFTGQDPTGAQTYLTNCASCHQQDGLGKAGVIPALAGNSIVNSGGPQSVIEVILGGVQAQKSYGPMAGLGVSMTDEQVALATNYIRQSWGNKAPATATPGMVATLRKKTHTLLGGDYPGGCPAQAQDDVAKVIADPNSGVQTLLQATNAGNIQQNANQIITKVRAANPKIAEADLVNSLTIAYCPVVQADSTLNAQQKTWQLDLFGEQVYTQASPGANKRVE